MKVRVPLAYKAGELHHGGWFYTRETLEKAYNACKESNFDGIVLTQGSYGVDESGYPPEDYYEMPVELIVGKVLRPDFDTGELICEVPDDKIGILNKALSVGYRAGIRATGKLSFIESGKEFKDTGKKVMECSDLTLVCYDLVMREKSE